MKKFLLTTLLTFSLPQTGLAQTTPTLAPAATKPVPAVIATGPTTAAAPTPVVTTPAPDTVVATVGGQDFTYAQFSQLFKLAIARTINTQGLPYSEEISSTFAPMRANFLPVYARQQALVQLATKAGFKANPGAGDDQIKALNAQFKTDDELKKALSGSGFESVDQYRQFLAEQAQVGDYLKSVQSKFKFSDSLVQSFYTMHKKAFTQQASACVKHILVGTEAEAQDIVKALNTGGEANSFDKLAQQKSKDPGSAAKGGDLGCLSQGDTVPEFDKASFEGPLNKVQVVKSQFGYHVLVVTKRNAAGIQPFEDVADKIRTQLANEAAQKYVESLIKRVPTTLHTDRLGVPVSPETTPAPAQK